MRRNHQCLALAALFCSSAETFAVGMSGKMPKDPGDVRLQCKGDPQGLASIDAARVTVRRVDRGDAWAFQAIFDEMSTVSREQRYLVPMPRFPGSMRDALASVDETNHAAAIAMRGTVPVGVSHAISVAESTVELAVEVIDRFHRRGIGTLLLNCVIDAAQKAGASRFQATILPQNAAVLTALRRRGIVAVTAHGLVEAEGPLEALRIDDGRGAESVGAYRVGCCG
jgi:GNAT superfamily N-acetyltransferase